MQVFKKIFVNIAVLPLPNDFGVGSVAAKWPAHGKLLLTGSYWITGEIAASVDPPKIEAAWRE